MPQNISVENNFIGGLKTEFTGLNFPENACTAAENSVFTIIGDVLSREGIDFEASFVYTGINRAGKAISTYKWNNVAGDGLTQIIVVQVGSTLFFFQSSAATSTSPLSAHLLASTINLSSFIPSGSALDPSVTECQFSDGNGYLFVYHSNLNPFYCTFNAGAIIGNVITVQVRDFDGVPEPGNPADSFRPPVTVLPPEHAYNLANQGWGKLITFNWTQNIGLGSTNVLNTGSGVLPISIGDQIIVTKSGSAGADFQTGSVASYNRTTGDITMTIAKFGGTGGFATWGIDSNPNLIDAWKSAVGNLPSNGDVWWNYKNTSNVFDPATTITSTTQNTGPAPKGNTILQAFTQDRTAVTSIGAFTPVTTFIRPKTGTWFQGRVWYSGVDSSVATTLALSGFYSWTEKIYFSQIASTPDKFAKCYQQNDPTSETLFDLLPNDGGVIQIQGCGSIYKLFPVQNGILVFAANGIWFLTGRQGIGFTADDYTITKISGVQSISSTSFINVLGYPLFWNEEGIYTVAPGQTGSLSVDNICVGTILSFYLNIPLQSKKFARGDYNPVDFQVQWCFRSTDETNVTDRYQFDSLLILNTVNKAFYPYSLTGTPFIHDIRYVAGPGGSTSPDPVTKYLTSALIGGIYKFTFSEERDDVNFVDWHSFDGVGVPYVSTFTTGYKLHGKAITKWQPIYVNMLSGNSRPTAYSIQGYWDYALVNADGRSDSNRTSTKQTITNFSPNFGMLFRRHKIRGHGYALQLKVTSVPGFPFEIQGWSILENIQQSA